MITRQLSNKQNFAVLLIYTIIFMKRKNIFLIGALIAISFLGNTQVITHTHDWTRYNGDDGYEFGIGIVTSDDGYVYSTGVFEQTVNFGSTSTPGIVSSNGIRDVYICKRDANGYLSWAISFGGSSGDDVAAIDIDSESNIYVTGRFYGTVDFDPSASVDTLTQTGTIYADSYICKFDKNGNLIWARLLNGRYDLSCRDITVDNMGDVHVVGSFNGQVDVDPDPTDEAMLGSGGFWLQAAFSLTLDQNGNFKKHLVVKANSNDVSINSVAVDTNFNQYFTGEFKGLIGFFIPGSSSYNISSTGTGSNSFILCRDASNIFQWVRVLETSNGSTAKSIKLDANNNIYTIGSFKGTIDLDPSGASNLHVESTVKTSLYISKLDVNGNFIYGKSISGSGSASAKGNVYGKDLHVTSGGSTYFTGYFNKTVDFNPGTGVKNITAVGAEDAYICGLNTYGNLWSINTIESMYSWGKVRNNAIDLNSSEDIYTTGRFTELVNFNPPGYAYFGISLGGYDEFVHKLERIQLPLNNPFFKSNIEANSTNRFEIDIFPNPTSGLLNLNLPGEESAQVLMYSASGRLVYSGAHNSGRSSISMDNLAEGVYILKITQGEKTENVRVVKK